MALTREQMAYNVSTWRGMHKADNQRRSFSEGFVAGVKWADAHQPSPWISVEDRLPEGEDNPDEYNAPYRARSSRNVVITDGVIVNRGYYSYARMRWEWNGNEIKVTHWMPIPELLK